MANLKGFLRGGKDAKEVLCDVGEGVYVSRREDSRGWEAIWTLPC